MSIDAAVQQIVQQTVAAMLPQIVAAVQAQMGNAAPAAVPSPTPAPTVAPTVVPAPAPDPFGGLGTPATAPQAVTPEMVQSLVMELTSHPTHAEMYKQQLVSAMNSLGIQSLPDTRPDQLAPLYNAFLAIKNGAAQPAPAQQPAAPPAAVSII